MKTVYEKFITGPLDVNTYVVRNEQKSCLLIDPSRNCEEVIDYLKTEELSPEAVVLTHGHFDHILGIPEIISSLSEIPIYIHKNDRDMLSQPLLNGSVLIGEEFAYSGENVYDLAEGEVEIGSFHFRILHVPGHSSGGCAVVMEDVCFCGDIIFAGSIGRTDLPGGDGRALVSGIRQKLLSLPDSTVLCPGHGGRTTVGREKKMNPFL